MARVEDWVQAAADEIGTEAACSDGISRELAAEIIEQYAPFERGVAYMPVPRCDSCRHWRRLSEPTNGGECAELSKRIFTLSIITDESFGCVQWAAKERA